MGSGYTARQVIDLGGRYVCPGFIDAHVHIESSMVPPHEFARAVVARGTTTVIIDPHEIANVLGLDGIRYMFDCGQVQPALRVCHDALVRARHGHGNGRRLPALV